MKFFTNQQIAKLLRQIEAAYILKGENKFKIIAYGKAADMIENSTIEVKDLWDQKRLSQLPGIGSSLASYLDELFKTGKVKHFEQVFSGIPASIFPLIDVPGFGPKKAYKLVTTLKLTNPKTVINDLLRKAKQRKIAAIEGFGEKSQQEMIDSLKRFKKSKNKQARMTLAQGYPVAMEVIEYLKKNKATLEALPLGSLRRMKATIGDIDIAVSTNHFSQTIDWFVKYDKVAKIIEKGTAGASVLLENGRQIDLRVQKPIGFGAMIQYFTGSKQHNIALREYALKKGYSLSEYGIKKVKSNIEFDSEEDFYNFLGMQWIPPEIRENTGEIEAAFYQAQSKQTQLPKLVEQKDIQGDLQIHSDYDFSSSHDLGLSSVSEIISKASKLGYKYVGISDHNPSYTNQTSRQIKAVMKRRKAYFEQINVSTKRVRVKIFLMLEIDIIPDGKLALPDNCFEFIDAAIVAIHSSFRQNKKTMTDRIIKGLSHPRVKILAHPTGRLLNKRRGYEVDWERLFTFCKEHNKAIEINAYPDRLDLPDMLVREAIGRKVKLVINTDSHSAQQMNNMKYGIAVARRGWATKDDILNCLPYSKFRKWLMS